MTVDRNVLRAGDLDRNRTVRLLQYHYEAGRLTVTELESRTQQAMAAKTLGQLDALLSDLPAEEPHVETRSTDPSSDVSRVDEAWPSRGRVGSWAIVMLGLIGIWAMSGRGSFWPAWPMIGIALAMGTRGLRREHRKRA